jgi:hypothetical protein
VVPCHTNGGPAMLLALAWWVQHSGDTCYSERLQCGLLEGKRPRGRQRVQPQPGVQASWRESQGVALEDSQELLSPAIELEAICCTRIHPCVYTDPVCLQATHISQGQ